MELDILQKAKEIKIEEIFSYDEGSLIKYYESLDLFFNGTCINCTIKMSQYTDGSKAYTEQKFYCLNCRFVGNMRYNTLFFNMKLSFKAFNALLYYFSQSFKEIECILRPFENLSVSYCTIREYTKLFREICHLYVQNILQDIQLPGPVEVDEACIYKLKKGRKGRLAKIIYWVFGLKCRTTGKVIIYPVLYRRRAIFISIIRKHVKPGSLILSDRFSAYWNNRTTPPTSYLVPYGYIHLGINHSIHFVSSINNQIHTNTIERVWRALKGKFRNYKPKKQIHQIISQFILESWISKEDRYYFMLYLLYEYNNAI